MPALPTHRLPLRTLLLCLLVLATAQTHAQTSGNIAYGQAGGKARAEQSERSERVLSKEDLPPANSMFLDASVLMNIKADEFVAVFAIARDAPTIPEAAQKMAATVKQLTDSLLTLHLRPSDIYVDLIAEPKTYTYDIAGRVAREKLAGFELKKNISIHYTDRDLLDKLVLAANQAQVYDLIKVDYIVKDTNAVQARLMSEASAVIHQKLARYQRLLGTHVKPSPQVYAERPSIHYPTELYDSYSAAESESVSRPANLDGYSIQYARKGRTFFFNGLDPNGFDKVINPVILEPVVQFTLYLKLKYDLVR